VTPAAPVTRTDRAAGRSRLFLVALLATVLVMPLSLPWRLSGLGFGAITLYAGLRLLIDLAALRRAGRTSNSWLGVVVGLATATFLMLLLAGQLALYPLFVEQERCVDRAITHLDTERCQAAFEAQRQELLRRFGQG